MTSRARAMLLVLVASGCSRAHAQVPPAAAASHAVAPPAERVAHDPDGNDDPPEDTGTGALPTDAHFERVGRPPLALTRVCDLRVLGDALYAAHANHPLGSDGATVTRYAPAASPTHPFSVAFDWNRAGEPTQGGGAGQGFLRVHRIGGRLLVPDTDPPYAGFGYVFGGTEGYVFVSTPAGVFAPARGEHKRPPGVPDAAGRAGAGVVPRGYHILDVIRFRGHDYASTGSVPPGQRPWFGPSPGALHVANDALSRWTYAVDYPHPWQNGVWRLTYMVRFRDRLYAGIQDYDGREPNDYVVIAPGAAATTIAQGDVTGVRVTPRGGAATVRWYADAGRLYWITLDRGGPGALRVTDDGDHWRTIALPPDAGRPTDVTRFRGALVVLTERGLFRLDAETPVRVAAIADARSPFEARDLFCAPPLAVFHNALYAGGQRDGALYRLADGPAPPAAPPPAR